MPPHKSRDRKEEPKLVIPDVRITPHIRIREGLWEHIAQGRLTPHDVCVYLTLHRHAKWGTGICMTSAASIAGNWGGQLKLNTVQVSLGRLRDDGYIKYPEGTGKRGVYPVLIDKYEPQVGPCKGWSLNAGASDDYDNPVYDYISGTPYGAAYGASAVDHAVRVWRVSGAPYGVSAGDWVVRQPLQAVIQLSSQALQAGQTGQASQARTVASRISASQSTDTRSPLDGKNMDDNSEQQIEFLDEGKASTTTFNIEDEDDELA